MKIRNTNEMGKTQSGNPGAVSTQEFAVIFGCSDSSVRLRIRSGLIRHVEGFSRPYKIPRSEVRRLLGEAVSGTTNSFEEPLRVGKGNKTKSCNSTDILGPTAPEQKQKLRNNN